MTRLQIFLLFVITPFPAAAGDKIAGNWALELPDGNPAWLKIGKEGATYSGELLWSVGSAKPVKDLVIEDNRLKFVRKLRWKPYGNAEQTKVIEKPMTGVILGDSTLQLSVVQFPPEEPDNEETIILTGKKLPPMPPQPNLAKVKFGRKLSLFNGKDLDGWKLSNAKKENGWSAAGGILTNKTPKTDFGAYGEYGNLITEAEFEDFRLSIEYNVEAGGNSGIYLRGMYEAQVVDRDSKMQGIQGPGAIFGRIAPSENAANPGGEWNRYVLTLVDRHITVELNGKIVIDNQPLEGCTGGGLSADDTAPGPIFLQGDHTSVSYRNIVLEPVLR